ncbi:MAG TPA: nuclear transport factor 2 family protein [Candidatus Krumholzibacteria bacterium]|nr:nuclear transport factor 2 family protein [Candidatus Krumholzibacteria bacterium]
MQRGTYKWIATLLLCASVAVVSVAAADSKPDTTKLQDELRATETAFAKTMADRDHAAFATFIADEAVFFGRKELRGKPAIVEAWKSLYEGKEAPFSWRSETVSVLDSGTLGLSSGPVFGPDGKQTGTFSSIWRHKADGKWEIIFDKGCPYCPQQ